MIMVKLLMGIIIIEIKITTIIQTSNNNIIISNSCLVNRIMGFLPIITIITSREAA